MSFQIGINSQPICGPQPIDVARDFCNLYYPYVTTRGMSSVLHMFDNNVKCNLNGAEFTGMHNVLVKMSENGISRFLYNNISCVYQVLTNDTLLLHVTGFCQAVTHYNTFIEWKPFSEIFVLKCYVGNKGSVVNYVFKYF